MRTGYSLFRLVAIFFDLAQDVLRLLLLGTRSSAALERFGQRQARDLPQLASKRLSSTLAMEIEAAR